MRSSLSSPPRRTAHVALVAAVLCVVLAAGRAAMAQPEQAQDDAAAQALFDKGRELMAAGDVAAACEAFSESQRMNPLPGTLLNLAKCNEMLGRLATAWVQYREALALAKADGRKDRIEFAETRLAELTPRVPQIVVELAPGVAEVEGLRVLRDGAPLGRAALGTALPVDPGLHVIEAEAPGFQPFRGEIEAREATIETVHIVLEPLPSVIPEPIPVPLPLPVPAPAPVIAQRPPPVHLPPPQDPGDALRTAGWIATAVGTAAMVAALATLVWALDEDAAAVEAGCSATTCATAEAQAHGDNASAGALAAATLLSIGAVAGGTGVVLVLLPLGLDDHAPAGASLLLGGAF
jgi:tetratricopeptide (TPR) repeat protein